MQIRATCMVFWAGDLGSKGLSKSLEYHLILPYTFTDPLGVTRCRQCGLP